MRSVLRVSLASLIFAALGAGLASAQSINFQLLVTVNGVTNNVPNDQTVPINTAVNTKNQVTVVATYTGATQATISSNPIVLGSTEFSAVYTSVTTPVTPVTPILLSPGQAVTFVVTYAPTTTAQANAQIEIPFTEPNTSGAPGTTGTVVNNAIILLFEGTSPAFTLFYVLQSNGNSVQIPSGGKIPFPATLLNSTASANLDILNTGSGPGNITAITQPPATSPFKVENIPPLPTGGFPVTPGESVPLLIQYTPTAVETDTAQITITFQDGSSQTVNLTGSGIATAFSYSYVSGTGTAATPVAPNGTITFPAVTVPPAGSTPVSSNVLVQVKNTGSVSATINSIVVSGTGFALSTALTTAPVLGPGGTYSFNITFTPLQPGTLTGQLAVGSDVFTLSGQGLGPSLTFSYVSPGGTVPVGAGGAVDFTPIPVSKSESVTFIINNMGTSTATISNISTSSTSTPNPFSVNATLPLTLASGASSKFSITFAPTFVGTVTGTLFIDNTQLGLLGTGTTPPALPSYTFTGPSGNVTPASQQNVSLTLASPYPLDLDGVLTLSTTGNYGTDPAVEFTNGSRTVDFVIPANTTSANFAGEGSEILLQTGTVAETVTLTPSFVTADGGVPVTPTSPSTLQFTVPAAAPVLEGMQVTDETSSGFTLLIAGYSTIRSLGSLNVTFTANSGYTLSASQFSRDVSGPAALWFQSSGSESLGGLFEITLPFTLTGPIPVNKTLIQAIASVSVTVTNADGTSGSVSAPVE